MLPHKEAKRYIQARKKNFMTSFEGKPITSTMLYMFYDRRLFYYSARTLSKRTKSIMPYMVSARAFSITERTLQTSAWHWQAWALQTNCIFFELSKAFFSGGLRHQNIFNLVWVVWVFCVNREIRTPNFFEVVSIGLSSWQFHFK